MTLTNQVFGKAMLIFVLTALVSAPAMARPQDNDPRWEDQILDAVAARPLGIVMTAGGAVIWGLSLPFSLLGGNAGEAADSLIGGPGRETFVRCLGCRSAGKRQNYEESTSE